MSLPGAAVEDVGAGAAVQPSLPEPPVIVSAASAPMAIMPAVPDAADEQRVRAQLAAVDGQGERSAARIDGQLIAVAAVSSTVSTFARLAALSTTPAA